MNELCLKRPSEDLWEPIWEYRQEYFDYGEATINGSCGLARTTDFNEWLELVLSIEKDKLRNNVHASTFFSIRESDYRIIGSVQLRHFLTPEWEQHGGHIGYGVRPSERRKGYGKQQLWLVLEVARQMNIPEVLIICDKDNIASSQTAISCGGRLIRENVYNSTPQAIYGINLMPIRLRRINP